MSHVETMMKMQQTRLLLSLDELRNFDGELTRSGACAASAPAPPARAPANWLPVARAVMRRPADYLPAFEEALREVVQQQDPSFAKTTPLSQLKIGLQGAFGAHHVSPRGLGAPLLNTAVCVEGIVTKCARRPRARLPFAHASPSRARPSRPAPLLTTSSALARAGGHAAGRPCRSPLSARRTSRAPPLARTPPGAGARRCARRCSVPPTTARRRPSSRPRSIAT